MIVKKFVLLIKVQSLQYFLICSEHQPSWRILLQKYQINQAQIKKMEISSASYGVKIDYNKSLKLRVRILLYLLPKRKWSEIFCAKTQLNKTCILFSNWKPQCTQIVLSTIPSLYKTFPSRENISWSLPMKNLDFWLHSKSMYGIPWFGFLNWTWGPSVARLKCI